MDEKLMKDSIPYFVHEGEMTRMERQSKRWFTAWLITFLMLICAVVFIIYRETAYEDVVTETYTAETDLGGTAIANGNGEVTVYGEGDLHQDNEKTKENP
jgi:hypothetical protein